MEEFQNERVGWGLGKKLFSGIHTVKFTDSKDKILAMMSHLKEEVALY